MRRPSITTIALVLVLAASGCAGPPVTASPTAASTPEPTATPAPDAPSGAAPPQTPVEAAGTSVTGQVAYVDGVDAQIFLLDLATGEHRQLTHLSPEDAELTSRGPFAPALSCFFGPNGLAWSPDGTQLAFSYGGCEGVIHTVDLHGTVRRIADGNWPAWSVDGSRLVFAANVPYCPIAECGLPLQEGGWHLQVVDVPDGQPRPISAHPSTERASIPSYSPDGTFIAYSGPLPDPPADAVVSTATWVMTSDGSDARLVARGTWPAGWLSDGRLVTVQPESGAVQALDVRSGAADDLGGSLGMTLVSPDGSRMLESQPDDATGASTVRLMATASREAIADRAGYPAAWSPDSRAAVVVDGEGVGGLVVLDREGHELGTYPSERLTNVVSAAWRPGT